MEYLDLWLMHYPAATDPNDPEGVITVIDVRYTDTWRAMEECVKMGLVRNIGISSSSSSRFLPRSPGIADDRFLKERGRDFTCLMRDQTCSSST